MNKSREEELKTPEEALNSNSHNLNEGELYKSIGARQEITKTNYLNNFARNKELSMKVLNQMGVDWKDLIQYPEDYRDAGAGVSGFIYYSETVPFAKRNLVLIINALNEFETETGCPLNKPTDDETQYFNWLSWFALETVIDDIMNFKESQEDC